MLPPRNHILYSMVTLRVTLWAHLNRTRGSCRPFVSMKPNNIHNIKKDIFLANLENKQSFISILGNTLEKSGCHVLHEGDDDKLIVKIAIKLNMSDSSVVVGGDTDLLILLIYFSSIQIERNMFTFKPEPKHNAMKIPYCLNIDFVISNLPKKVISNILFAY